MATIKNATLVFAMCLLGSLLAARPAASETRPNIIFITTDDMRVRDLQAMPNVAALLSAKGMTFTASYVPFPLCCPARATWVTGQYNHNNGVMGNESSTHPAPAYSALDATNTVATWLRGAGYQTAFVGKYLNGYGTVKPVVVPPGWVEWHASVAGGNYFYTKLRENTGGVLATHIYDGPYQVDLYKDIATSIIRQRVPATEPLFLWVSFFAPHNGAPAEADDPAIVTPAVPPRWKDYYASAPLPKDPNFNEADVSDKPAYVRSKKLLTAKMQAMLKESNAQRWESLRAVDDAVADIVQALQAAGELDNSVIVFSSDNGWMMGEHRIHAGKTVPYEESNRVPLIIRGPGFAPGASRGQPVASIDLPPTFADLADTTPGLAVDGLSLLPLATDPAGWPTRTLVLEAGPTTLDGPDIYHGIRTDRYKYIRHSTGEVEFYDLIADPYEMRSLTNEPAYDRTQADLEALLVKMENCAGAACWSPTPDISEASTTSPTSDISEASTTSPTSDTTTTPAATSSDPPTADPPTSAASAVVAQWNMDNTFGTTMVDSSGNGNNGTTYDVVTSGGGYIFNGTSSNVVVPDSPTLSPGTRNFSVTVKVQTDNVPPAGGDYALLSKGISTTSGGEYKIEIIYSNGKGVALCVMTDAKGRTVSLKGTKNLADNVLHTLTCSKTATSVTLRVDSLAPLTKTISLGSISNSKALTIGVKLPTDPGGDWYKGTLRSASISVSP